MLAFLPREAKKNPALDGRTAAGAGDVLTRFMRAGYGSGGGAACIGCSALLLRSVAV